MKENANSVRVGDVVDLQGKLCRVLRTQHTMPGKGGAFVQMELRDVVNGTKLNERFRSSEGVELIDLDKKNYQYLYGDEDTLTFMDLESYEQMQVGKKLIGDDAVYLHDGMQVKLESYDGKPIGVELPETVILAVAETEAAVKGQTSAASYKPAILENGVRSSVPQFVSIGDKLIIKTEDGSYVERAK